MEFLYIIKAILLGMVEGLTEFAPVSSTGHMIIVDEMWLQSAELLGKYVANTFKVVIQLGSILAVVILFKDRFFEILGLKRRSRREAKGQGRLTLVHVIIGLLPATVLGLVFKDYIDDYLFSAKSVLVGLVAGAVLMILADKLRSKQPKTETVDQVSYKQAFVVGLIQCISLWPGFSRSGSTISGGVLLGMSHRAAADFTFIMAVPIMFGASLLSLMKNWHYFTLDVLPFFAAGFLSAFVFALFTIRIFLKLINKIKLVPFAIYRLVLAGLIYIVYF